jgi:hypothetical protein
MFPHTLAMQPIFQCPQAVFDKNRNAVFPCGPSAKHPREINPGFGRQFQRILKRLVARSLRQVNKWHARIFCR